MKVKKYLELFQLCDRGEGRIWAFTKKARKEETPEFKSIQKVIHELEGSMDFAYEQVHNCLEWLEDNRKDEVVDLMCEAVDSAVSVYTSDLTAWLAENVNNVWYLEDAARDVWREPYKDENEGNINILMKAQYKAIEEIWQAVVNIVMSCK